MADALTPVVAIQSSGVPGGGASQLYKVFSAELVNAAADVESVFKIGGVPGIELSEFTTFGLYAVATSPGTVAVVIKILQSYDNVAAHFAQPDVNGFIITLADTNIHQVTVAPTPMPYFRLQLDGQGGNDAGTRITVYIWMRTS